MAFFQPTRTSPKAAPKSLPGVADTWDSTLSSSTSSNNNAIAALSGLSSRDVRIIDAVIRRVPSATTFPTMFKAYNAVLQEHGLDAQNDVVYYRILLKVGVLKGVNWGARWEMAKEQLGYDALLMGGDETEESETEGERADTPVAAKAPTKATYATTRLPRINASPERHVTRTRFQGHMFIDPEDDSAPSEKDSFTVHSHREDEETATTTEGDATEEEGASADSPTTLVQPAPTRATERNALHLQTGASMYPPLPSIAEFLPVQAKKAQYSRPDHYDPPSDTPSSLHSLEEPPPIPVVRRQQRSIPIPDEGIRAAPLASRITTSSKPPLPAANYEDTWRKIRVQRDEKEADRFREIILFERYFHLWLEGLRWIKSANAEVSKNRDKYISCIALDKWRSLHIARQQYYEQGTKWFESSLLREMLKKWRKKLKLKKMLEWREDMRRRMAQVRQMVDKNLERRYLVEWRRAYQLRLSESWHERQLQKRFLDRWRHALLLLQDREHSALELEQSIHHRQFVDLWDHWRMKTTLCRKEKQISHLVELRLLSTAMTKWRNSLNETRELDTRHNWHIRKMFFVIWRKKYQNLMLMRKKSDKYKARQDAVLVRAIMHVWVTKERGLLLERAIQTRRLQAAWQVWRTRAQDIKILQAKADTFANQANTIILHSSMTHWRQNLLNHQKLSSLAQQYYDEHLKGRMLMGWRIKLRQYVRMLKQARVARRYLVMRKAWDKWVETMRVKAVQKMTLQRYFNLWRAAAARDQYHRFAQRKMELLIDDRLKRSALRKWTERIIFLKLREIETSEKRYKALTKACFEKWKLASAKCVDMNRLMQSHLLVKDEGKKKLVRRAFHGWLVSAKAARHRQKILAEREEEIRLVRLASAWDTWREKLQALRLEPLEKTFRLQQEKNILYRAFVIWNQRTMSTPAIRFSNHRLKATYWQLWREVMPQALQAKKAREFDKKKLLSRVLDKWVQAYRTKVALKAVARARYLRLPSGAPRKSLPYSSVLSGALYSSRSAPSAPSATSGRSTRPASPIEDDNTDVEEKPEVRSESHFGAEMRFGVRSRLLPLGGRPSRPLRSQGDETEDDNKADFWLALRRRHGRAGPSTARSDDFDDD